MNINRKKGSPAIKPDDIHPMRGTGKAGGIPLTRDNLHYLKALTEIPRRK